MPSSQGSKSEPTAHVVSQSVTLKPKPTQARVPAISESVEWKSVKHVSSNATQKKDKLLQEGWSVPVAETVRDLCVTAAGVCLSSISEARKAMNELKGTQPLGILAPANIDGQGQELHVLVEDPSGRCQVRRRFLFQLGSGEVTFMADKEKKAFKPDSVKIVISFAKVHTTGETLEFAQKNPQLAVKKWLELRAKVRFLDVRQPTRVAGATEQMQAVAFLPASSWISALRASGTDGVFVRPFFENDQDKLVYRSVPLPRENSLDAAIRQAAFIGEGAFGVVPFGQGYGVRVKSENFEEVLRQVQPENADSFLGKRWEISGLPLAMGPESLQDFLGNWQVKPLYTFRQGFRRTWIVRAISNPTENVIVHEFGIAVIKDVVQKQCSLQTERYQAPRLKPSSQFVRSSGTETPKSWAGIVAGDSATSPKGSQHRSAGDGSVCAAAVSRAPVPVTAAVPTPAPQARVSPQPQHCAPTFPADLSTIMSAAIEAALKPMKDRLEATILPMQRTLEGLQAEFVAFRAEEKNDMMTSGTAADAKRLRIDA